MRMFFVTAAAMQLVACGTTPVPSSSADPVSADRIYATELTKAQPGHALLVVTRDKGMKGKACIAGLYVDGAHVADLRSSEQVRLFVEEGEHVVGVSATRCMGGTDQTSVVVTRAKPTLLHIASGDGEGMRIEPSAF